MLEKNIKYKIGNDAKKWTIVPAIAILLIMAFPAVASAKMAVSIGQNEDTVKFTVKNVGDKPEYVLNALTILDENGNPVYTSQDLSSADLLKVSPGVSYEFDVNTNDMPEGKYSGKIYSGDNARKLTATSMDFMHGPMHRNLIFFTDKKFYSLGERVTVSLMNLGMRGVFANVNNWQIKSQDTGSAVSEISQDCSFGYGGCADSFEQLGFLKSIQNTWNQKDFNGNQVGAGQYVATAEYSMNDPSSGRTRIETISTDKFFIRPYR